MSQLNAQLNGILEKVGQHLQRSHATHASVHVVIMRKGKCCSTLNTITELKQFVTHAGQLSRQGLSVYGRK